MEIIINGRVFQVEEGEIILEVCLNNGIYVPHICFHPEVKGFNTVEPTEYVYRKGEKVLPSSSSWEGCSLCVVEVNGEPKLSCITPVSPSMEVKTESPQLTTLRQKAILTLLENHPHACLVCSQKEGCSLTQCSSNVKEEERCCPEFGKCELEKVVEYIGIPEGISKYEFQDLPKIENEPLFLRDFNLCIGCLRCVRICKERRGVEALGFVLKENTHPIVGLVQPTLKDSGCRLCGSCVEVCPTGALRYKKEKKQPPCKENCPIGIDVPKVLSYFKDGDFTSVLQLIENKSPFPSILAKVCLHPCEDECNRKEIDAPVAICEVKRSVVENKEENKKEVVILKKIPKKIGIIGGGVVGLTVGFYLRRKGYEVTIFEKEEELGGGLLMYIPKFRLPKEVVRKEVSRVLKLGIKFEGRRKINSLEEVKDYDAIFVGIGAGRGRKLGLGEERFINVFYGVEFLREVNLGKIVKMTNKVGVVGGGDTAMDVALTVKRLGGEVEVFAIEKEEELFANEESVRYVKEEEIPLSCGWGVGGLISEGNKVKEVEWVKCISVFDGVGNFMPKFDEKKKKRTKVDTLIVAIGQEVEGNGIEVKKRGGGFIVVDENLNTNIPFVFAGGDVVGVGSIVKAINEGRRGAISIDKFLGGDGVLEEEEVCREVSDWLGKDEGFWERKRVTPKELDVKLRVKSFEEIKKTIDLQEAQEETKRCLRCDIKGRIKGKVLPPIEEGRRFVKEEIEEVPEKEGVFLLLTKEKEVVYIKGVENLRKELLKELTFRNEVEYFRYEEAPMYTKRESELLQKFSENYGKLPKYNDELEELF